MRNQAWNRSRSLLTRQRLNHGAVAFILGALMLSMTSCTLWTIRPINQEGGTLAPGQGAVPGKPGFSAAAYVGSIWDSQVLPTVQEKATDLQTVLTALQADSAAAGQTYGHREGQRPYNFLVKGEGKVLAVDTSTRSGSLKIDLLPGDGQQDAAIQLGPVIRGTSLRDALPFIQFNEFTNQLEYADVSNQLNDRVSKDVIGTLDLANLSGKTVAFQGAFTFSKSGSVLITPVKIQVQ